MNSDLRLRRQCEQHLADRMRDRQVYVAMITGSDADLLSFVRLMWEMQWWRSKALELARRLPDD